MKTKKTAPKAPNKPTLGQRVAKADQPTKLDRKKEPKATSMSGLDAAALVLSEAKTGMTAKAIVEAIKERGMADGLKGKTPHATIYAAIITEIAKKGKDSRFARGSAKGLFIARL